MGSTGRLDDKVAVVSGAARGMGAAHAKELVDEGATVVLGDILDEEGSALADELGAAARFVHLDVTDPDQWRQAVSTAVSEFGTLDVLVNNAGITNGNLVQEYELSAWRQIIEINLTGTFLGIQSVTPTMIGQGHGSIINVSSIQGLRGSPGTHGYTASKFGIRGLTKSVAQELAGHGIRVNSIHPGMVHTSMTEGIPEDLMPIPLRRAARPEEVSKFVCFLASDDSSYATGSEFVVDGGLISGIPFRGM
jgi:3alpha(or 20beta)-hydroxysteroid dehydrogenase